MPHKWVVECDDSKFDLLVYDDNRPVGEVELKVELDHLIDENERLRAAVLAERDACAKVVEKFGNDGDWHELKVAVEAIKAAIAAAIRTRKDET